MESSPRLVLPKLQQLEREGHSLPGLLVLQDRVLDEVVAAREADAAVLASARDFAEAQIADPEVREQFLALL